jgi:gliding motility-associated-like protein
MMRKFTIYAIAILFAIGLSNKVEGQCYTYAAQDPGAAVPGAGVEAAIGTWNIVTNNFNGQDYAVFSLTQGYTYEWQVCGAGGFATPLLTLFVGTVPNTQTMITYNSGACATISYVATNNQSVALLLSQTDCGANGTNLTLQWRATCSPTCGADVDHGGADWIISADTYIGGNHTNINNFVVNAGVTASLSCHTLYVEAVNININGTIDGNFKGSVGGLGGNGGSASIGGDGTCNSGSVGQAGSNGTGSGPGFAGGNGLLGGCTALNCGACTDGYIAGSGGAGSGGGGAHFDDGGTSGSGAQAADVNGTDAIGGFGGNGPWFGGFAYGDNTSFAVIAGSGGAGGGGGGGGYTPGTNGGNGGAGGARIELIATNNVNIPVTGAIYCNGFDGGNGGNGGYGSLDNAFECFDDANLESTDNCGACPAIGNYYGSGGAGGGAGGGSGGGILISSADLAIILGTLEVAGGEGGDAGFPNTTQGACFHNAKGGSGGVGGRIKIFRNPCLENQINPSSNVEGGLPGASIGGSVERAPSGVQLLLNHPSYVAFDGGAIQTDQDICTNGLPNPITMSTAPSGGIGTYSYQWWQCNVGDCTNPPVGYTPIGGQTSDNYTPPTLVGTTYYSLMVQSGSEECREWTAPVIVTVHPDPTISITADNNDVCEGQPIQLTATIMGGHGTCTIQWQYSDDGGSTWTNIGTGLTTYDVNTSTSFSNRQYRATYECTSDGCDIAISNVEIINVAEPPSWDTIIVDPLELCLGGDVTLSATVVDGLGGTIEWFISPAGMATWVSVTSPDTPALGSWDYQPVYTPGGTGCGISDAPINTVVVVEDPTISISATETEHCEDDPLTLTATASGGSGTCSYQWQYYNGSTWVDVGADSDTYIIPADVTFTNVPYRCVYTCTGEGCNQAISNEINITIFENPTVTASANPNPQCEAEPVDLTATGAGGLAPYTYTWDNGLGVGQNHTVNPIANTTYTVTVEDDNGCTAEGTVDVVINQLPTVTATANPNPQCEGDPVDLSATGAGGTGPYTYDWDNGLGAGQNHIVTPLVNTTYTVTVEDSNGCTAEGTVDVVINELPTVTADATPNPQCANEPVDLSATGAGGTGPYTYTWDNGLGAGQNHTVTPAVNTTYTVTVEDSNGCTSEGSVDVVLNTLPNVTADAIPNPQCANEPVDLSANGGGGTGPYTYTWDNGLGAGQNHTVNPASNTTYTVTVEDSNGCTAEVSVDVIVNELPTVTATANPNPQCANEPVDLSATGSNGTGPYTYTWDNGLGAGQNHTVNPVANTTYTVTVEDSNGCTNQNTVDVVINDLPSVVVTETAQATCGSNNGEATATPSGGLAPYDYEWDNGDTSADGIAENLPPGPIVVTVTDDNGCTISGSVVITSPSSMTVVTTEITPVTCFGGNDGVGNIDISGGNDPYDVTWDNGTTSGSSLGVGIGNFDITNLTAGTYTVQVTDSDMCVEVENLVITEPAEITLNTNITSQLLCYGDSDAEAELTIGGGTADYDLTWDNGSTSGSLTNVDVGPHTITNLDAGTYNIVVTDDAGCTASFTMDVNQPDEITITSSLVTEPSCFGYNDGQGSVTIGGGTTNYDLTWDNGSTSGSLSGVGVGPHTLTLDSGTYTLQVTDANGCTQSSTLDITEPPVFDITLALVQDVTCFSGTDGEFDITLLGGTPDYDITYDNGTTSGSFNNVGVGPHNVPNLDSGTYTVVATDDNGCTVTDNILVDEPNELLLSASMTAAATCFGYSDGEGEFTISGGVETYDVTWDNGTTSGSINGINASTQTMGSLTAGTYTVVATDANGCTVSDNFDITEPPQITNVINVTSHVTCFGGADGGFDILISGGTANYDIDWSNGVYSDNLSNVGVGPHNITNIPAGNYDLTITDANSCEQIESFTINEPSEITITNGVITNVSCFGGADGEINITIGGGTPVYDLTWDNGSTSGSLTDIPAGLQTLTNLDAGNYLIEVTDDNGCVQSDNIIIDAPSSVLNLGVLSVTDASCVGVPDGSATVEATGGEPPYTFAWDNPNGLDENITNVGAGTYNVTVTDSWNCSITIPVVIGQPLDGLTATYLTTDVSCPGDSDGSITLTPSGGTAPYTYVWDPNVSSNETASGLAVGTYNITISDAGTCVLNMSVDVDLDPNALSLSFASTDSVTCFGGNDGSLTILATGGLGPYDYAWSNGPVIETTTGAAGNYTVTVTDANMCSVTADSTIYEPALLESIVFDFSDVNCFGGSDGQITLETTGGTPSYTYYWEDELALDLGINTPTASGLTAGTYYVTISDDNACGPVTLSQVISEPAAGLTVNIIEVNQPTCNGDSDGSISAIAAGGTMPVATYQWAAPIDTFTGQMPIGLSADNYEVTITDDNGCTATNTFTLNEPAVVGVDITVVSPSCNGDSDGSALANGTGGNGGFTYHWEDDIGTTLSDVALLDNIAIGTYYVTATDALGCSITSSTIVTEPAVLTLTVVGVDASTYGNNDGSATANPLGGTMPYNYEWENSAAPGVIISTDQTALNLTTGTYCVTVTDDNGCTVSDCVFIDQPPDQLAGVLANHDNISCFGEDDGTITINGYGGTPAYIFEWEDDLGTPIGSGPTISNLEPGDYYFTITDQLAYTWDTMITIIEPPVFVFNSISNTDETCYGGSDAHVEVVVSGGTPPYSYLWEDASGPIAIDNDTLYNVPAGDYFVTITDANGCGPLTSNTTINEPPEYTITISLVSNPLCNGDSNGEITTSVAGGTPPYASYAWAAPIDTYTGTNPNGLAAGLYTVTVTDDVGCTTSDTYDLTEPTAVDGTLSFTPTTGFGMSDGSVTVIASEGTPGYTYEWEDSSNPGVIISTSDNVNGLAAGNYCVTVYDSNMCEFTDCIDVTEPGELIVTIDAVDVDCNGNDNGSVDAVVTGGVPDYSYEWRNSGGTLVSNNQSVSNLVPDTYFVTVTDFYGFTATSSVVITEPDIITSPVVTLNHVTCYGLSDGNVTLAPTGGTIPYTISWYEITTPSVELSTTSILNGVPAGSYVFSLEDDNGCTHDTTIIINQPDQIQITNVETNHIQCPYDVNTGWAVVTFTGGTPDFTYTWTDAGMIDLGVNNDTITGLAAGDYNIEINDINGCPSDDADFTITIPDAFVLNSVTDSVSCFNGTDGSILLTVTGGTPVYSYAWTPNQGDTNNPTDIPAGTYTVTVTDNNSCTAQTSIDVGQPDAVVTSISNTDVTCYGGSDAQVQVVITGGSAPYTYYWEDDVGPIPVNNDTLYNVPAGNYFVTITDANGCGPYTETTLVNQPPEYTITIDLVSNPLCNGDFNGELNTTVLGGTPPYVSYQWDAPIATYTGTNPTGLGADTYTVTVTDNSGCTATDTYILTEPTAVEGILSTTPATGFGASDGSVSVIASEGNPPYTYEWEEASNPGVIISTSDLVENLPAGNYCVTVYDFNMCTYTNCIELVEPDELLVDIDAIHIDCNGNNNGSVDAVVTGGVPDYTYEWRNSADVLISNDQSVVDLIPDTYYVTVTDFYGYTDIDSVTIVEPDPIISPVSVLNNVSCYSLSDGNVTLNPSGGIMPYTISWYEINTPSVILSTNSILSDVPAGSYVFSLIDDNGCTHDTTIVITQPAPISITGIETHHLACPYDTNTGWAVVSFVGGNPDFTYTWMDASMTDLGVNNDTITGLTPGNYNVEINDINGCPSDNYDFAITIPDAFDITAVNDSVSCFGGTDGSLLLTVTGGTPDYVYTWDPVLGDTNNPTDLSEGTYNVTITDTNSCTVDTSFIVGQPDAELAILTSQNIFIECYGDYTAEINLNLTGGTLPYTIEWENTIPESDSYTTDIEGDFVITNLAASEYSITITDVRNCEVFDTYTITQPDDITYSFDDIVEASCNGFSDASVTLNASGGTGTLSFLWDDMVTPITHATYNNILAGWHYVTITDANNCQKIDSIFIDQPNRLTSDLVDELSVLCFGDTTAFTMISISGGTPDYDISWFNSSYEELGTDLWINNLGAGEYYLSITDANMCEYVDTFDVIEPPALATVMDSINPSCYLYQDGQLWVTVSGGTPGYNYSWDTPGATNSDTAFSVPQGLWFVTVTDANLCRIIDSIEIVHPDDILIEDTTTHVDCSAFMGTSTIYVSGGTEPYEYIWSTEDETSFIQNLPGGEHYVTVTDFNGCIKEDSINVPVVGGIDVTITQTEYILCFGEYTADIQADVLGHPPYSFEWNITSMIDTSHYYDLPAGDYEVIVTDSWNCMGDTTYTVTQPDDILITFTSQDVLCRNDSTGWATADITGGTGGYTLSWQHDGSANDSIYNLPVGTYYLDVVDANACEASNFISITEPDSALFAAIGVINTTCFSSNDGQAFASGRGGTPPYSYYWSGPNNHNIDTAVTSTNLFPGIYELTVTDANQCTYYTQAFIEEPGPIQVTIDQYSGPTCLGNWDGYIALDSITGGTPPYYIRVSGEQVSWEQPSLLIDSLFGGTYRIDIIDANNCIQWGESVAVTLIDADIDCLQIPAAFSPNGDGYNDYWQIDNLYMFPKMLIQVYNRWGQLLYEGGAFDDFWDGTYNGNLVPTGSYLYHIDMNNNLPPRTGTVTIVR